MTTQTLITAEVLKALRPDLPTSTALVTADKLNRAALRYGINTPLRVRHFLAQLAHESGFKPVSENLNYSAARLAAVWPYRYAVDPRARVKQPNALAIALARSGPEAIANNVYANRMGNGPESSGDGWNYRGRGFVQITGKANYQTYGQRLGFDLVRYPDQAAQIGVGALVAASYWDAHGLNRLADANNALLITRAINGGENGLSDRLRYLGLAERAITRLV